MNRYALMIMLIVGSLGGLVLASNYGVFEEEGVSEGTVTDPTYGTGPIYNAHAPPLDFETSATIGSDQITIIGNTYHDGAPSDLLDVEAHDSLYFYRIGRNYDNTGTIESKMIIEYVPPENAVSWNEATIDYFDVFLFCQIKLDNEDGSIQGGELTAITAGGIIVPIAEIDPLGPSTPYGGEEYYVDINGMKIEQVQRFELTTTIENANDALEIDRFRVLMTHGKSKLGDDEDWWHIAEDNPGTEKKEGTSTRKFTDDNDYSYTRDAGWDFNYETRGRSGAHYAFTNWKDSYLDFEYRYEFDGEWGYKNIAGTWVWKDATVQNCDFYFKMEDMSDWQLEQWYSKSGSVDDWDSGWDDFQPASFVYYDYSQGKYVFTGRKDNYKANIGDDKTYTFDTKATCTVDTTTLATKCEYKLRVNPKTASLEFQGHGFADFDYPSVDYLNIAPDMQPLSSNFRVRVKASSHYDDASIRDEYQYGDVQAILFNDDNPSWNSDHDEGDNYPYSTWLNLQDRTSDTFDGWVSNSYEISQFESGQYTVWVKVKDSKNHETYEFFTFRVLQGAATINPQHPINEEENEISDLYDVPLVVEVEGKPGYEDNGVNLTLFDAETGEDLTGLVPMEPGYQGHIDPPIWWNYTIDPYDFGNGWYKLVYYAKDIIGDVERSIMLHFNNKEPLIDFNDHYDYMPIRQLYDYLINISITDAEGDAFSNVSLCFYNLTEDEELDQQVTPWYNLTNQETLEGEPTDYWLQEIEPIYFTNGELYYMEVRVNSTYGFNYDGIHVLFERLNPSIQYLPQGQGGYIIDSTVDQGSQDYYDGEGLFYCDFELIQGNYSTSNFTWYIASDPSLNNVYEEGFIDYELGVNVYPIEFDPRLLPNGNFWLGVEITNLTDHTFGPYKTYLDINYYLFNEYPYIENYVFDDLVDYNRNDVVTNDYVIGKTNITYTTEPRAYNYVFNLRDSSILDYVYSIYPEYKIFRENLTYYETPKTDISTGDTLYFEFGERPPEDIDTLQFNMKTPEIHLRDEFEKPKTGETLDGREYMKIELVLESDHYFSDVHCVFKPSIPISSASDYEYSLYILDGENWEKVDVEVKFSSDSFNQMWQFDVAEIAKNGYEQLTFQIEGIKKEGVDFDWGPILFSLITAGVLGGLTLYVIPAKTDLIKDNRTLRKKKWIYYVIATAITAGSGIGMFFGASALGASLITYAI